MTRIAYLDCFSGVSGNMLLGALIDAGASPADIREQVSSVLPDFSLEVSGATRGHIGGAHVKVVFDSSGHHHRGLSAILGMIRNSGLSRVRKERATAVFRRLAEAEALVHRIEVDKVHFHEVGAVDAIVDIVGTVVGLDLLGVERLVCSPLPMSRGTVECAHGKLPLPAPATLELIKGVPVVSTDLEVELVTPTGAALVTSLAGEFGHMPPMKIEKTGAGLGDREIPGRPNIMRIVLGEAIGEAERAIQMEAAVDDMSPEHFDLLMERLHEAGALEVMFVPAQMKKNRPGVLVRVLLKPPDRERVADALLNNSNSIGLRWHEVTRKTLDRKLETIDTAFGPIGVKRATRPDGSERIHLEYDDLRRAAREHNLGIEAVEREALRRLLEMAEDQ